MIGDLLGFLGTAFLVLVFTYVVIRQFFAERVARHFAATVGKLVGRVVVDDVERDK